LTQCISSTWIIITTECCCLHYLPHCFHHAAAPLPSGIVCAPSWMQRFLLHLLLHLLFVVLAFLALISCSDPQRTRRPPTPFSSRTSSPPSCLRQQFCRLQILCPVASGKLQWRTLWQATR
jgi:hypothetical protein